MEDIYEQEAKLKRENCGRTIEVLDSGFVRLVDFLGNDTSIVQAARVSFNKGSKGEEKDKELLRYLMRHRHTSPLEMVEFKFHFKLPIFVARQIIRHRTANVNEQSSRYSKLNNGSYVPNHIRVQDKFNKQGSSGHAENEEEIIGIIEAGQNSAFADYDNMLAMGAAKEMARVNLPVSAYTQWYWKMDLHNLFHFLGLRLHPHAQWETREYAKAVFELIKPIVPVACEAFEDYRLNSCTFSAKEMKALKLLLSTGGKWDWVADQAGLEGLERKEFFDKIK
jgi:thymidylate synthase (FAD)